MLHFSRYCEGDEIKSVCD